MQYRSDWIVRKVRLCQPRSNERFRFGSTRVCRCALFLSRCSASSRLDLGFCRLDLLLFVLRRNFFVFYATNPISGIRAGSMRRCVARVEHNGLWALILMLLPSHVYWLILRDSGIEAARTNFTRTLTRDRFCT